MNFDGFTGQVHHRLELPGTAEALRAIRATSMTLGQRIQEGEVDDLTVTPVTPRGPSRR